MKHTQGEWGLAYDAQGPCMIMHPTKRGVAIASLTNVHKPSNGFHDMENRPEERNANAYLLFAAPKLLEAGNDLYHALDMLMKELRDMECNTALGLQIVGAREKWNKAIAKAKGE